MRPQTRGEEDPRLTIVGRGSEGQVLRVGQLGLVLVGFIALILATVASVILTQRNREAFEVARHTRAVLSDTAMSVELLSDAETGQRGFLLTERENYLAPYKAAVGLVPAQLDRLVAETAGLPIGGQAESMRTSGLAKIAELKKSLEVYQQDGRAAAIAVVMTDTGKNLMDEVRASAAAIRADQQRLLLERLDTTTQTSRFLIIAEIGTAILVVFIALFTGAGFYRSIRALRATQDQLEATNANLEGIVESRTMALRQANDEIQKFAYIVSHDLRAPLVNIMGFTAELETAAQTVSKFVSDRIRNAPDEVPAEIVETINEDVPEAFRFIKTSTAKMDGLIGAILKLSREGRRVLTPEPLSLRMIVENIAATLKHRTEEIGAQIVVQPLPNLTADRLAIEQIFSNLLDNAVKYLAPDRPGVVTVRGHANGPFAYFEIEDNGRGIAPTDHERVFELFRRAGQQNVPGEGIGLAYVRQLVYRLGGTITLDSTFGQGTIFKLKLPLVGSRTQRDAA